MKIERISEAKYANTAETKRIRAYWKPDGKTVDAAHAKELNDWLQANAGGTHLTEFMYGATPAQKKAMIDALNIPEEP